MNIAIVVNDKFGDSKIAYANIDENTRSIILTVQDITGITCDIRKNTESDYCDTRLPWEDYCK